MVDVPRRGRDSAAGEHAGNPEDDKQRVHALGHAGSPHKRKDLEEVVRAANEFKEAAPGHVVLLHSPLQRLRAEASEEHMVVQVTDHPRQTFSNVIALLYSLYRITIKRTFQNLMPKEA